jgi:hypothetical protein
MIEAAEKDDLPALRKEGKALILSQLGLMRKYPQLEEPWMDAVIFAFSKLPPESDGERQVRDIANSRIRGRRHEEGQALKMLEAVGSEVRATVKLMDKATAMLMSPREKGAEEKALEKEISGLECRLAASRKGLEAPQSKTGGGAACGDDEDSWNDVAEELDREIVAETAETMELAVGAKKAELAEIAGKAEAEWDGKLATEESRFDGYTKQLAEQIGEAAAYTKDRSAAVRREAAKVLITARDAHSLISFCYLEMDTDARKEAFEKAVEIARAAPDNSQIGMGMRLSGEERSMLLRMVEGGEPGIAPLAWEFAEWLLDGGKLDGEQMDFVEMRAKEADCEAAARVLSKRAKIWISEACGGEGASRVSALAKVLDATWSGLELDEEQKELAVEFTDDCDAKVAAQAFLLALELCRSGALAPEQVASLVKKANNLEDAEKRAGALVALSDRVPGPLEDAGAEMLLAMAMVGQGDEGHVERGVARALKAIATGNVPPGLVEAFLEAVDSLKGGVLEGKQPRIFECVRQYVAHDTLTEKAAQTLRVERLSQIILDTVQPGRASGVPARRSNPPQEAGKCAQPQAMKACGGKG